MERIRYGQGRPGLQSLRSLRSPLQEYQKLSGQRPREAARLSQRSNIWTVAKTARVVFLDHLYLSAGARPLPIL